MFVPILKVVLRPLALGSTTQKQLHGFVRAATPDPPLLTVSGIVLIAAVVSTRRVLLRCPGC
nr:hypothetical protein [uncultured Paracoccus sp.]